MCNFICPKCSPCIAMVWLPRDDLRVCCCRVPLRLGCALFAIILIVIDAIMLTCAVLIALRYPLENLVEPTDPVRKALFVIVIPLVVGGYPFHFVYVAAFALWLLLDVTLLIGILLRSHLLLSVWVWLTLERLIHIITDIWVILVVMFFNIREKGKQAEGRPSHSLAVGIVFYHFISLLLLVLLWYPRQVVNSYRKVLKIQHKRARMLMTLEEHQRPREEEKKNERQRVLETFNVHVSNKPSSNEKMVPNKTGCGPHSNESSPTILEDMVEQEPHKGRDEGKIRKCAHGKKDWEESESEIYNRKQTKCSPQKDEENNSLLEEKIDHREKIESCASKSDEHASMRSRVHYSHKPRKSSSQEIDEEDSLPYGKHQRRNRRRNSSLKSGEKDYLLSGDRGSLKRRRSRSLNSERDSLRTEEYSRKSTLDSFLNNDKQYSLRVENYECRKQRKRTSLGTDEKRSTYDEKLDQHEEKNVGEINKQTAEDRDDGCSQDQSVRQKPCSCRKGTKSKGTIDDCSIDTTRTCARNCTGKKYCVCSREIQNENLSPKIDHTRRDVPENVDRRHRNQREPSSKMVHEYLRQERSIESGGSTDNEIEIAHHEEISEGKIQNESRKKYGRKVNKRVVKQTRETKRKPVSKKH